jgi:hypothetical protein
MIRASAAALVLLAAIRPHAALVALALLVPIVVALRLASGADAYLLVAAVVTGALISALRPRMTPLRAQRPAILPAAAVLTAAIALMFGVSDTLPFAEGTALSFVAARHARDAVMRPVHLIRAAVIGGVIGILFGAPTGGGAGGFGASLIVLLTAVMLFVWTVMAFAIRVGRGLWTYPRDLVLWGALSAAAGGIGWLTRDPRLPPEWMCPFWILIGAIVARADGDAQRPLATD